MTSAFEREPDDVDYFIGEEGGAAGQMLPLVYNAQRAADGVSG